MSHVPPTLKEEVKQGLHTSENLGAILEFCLPQVITLLLLGSPGRGLERDAEVEGQTGLPPLAHQWGSGRREPGQGQLFF